MPGFDDRLVHLRLDLLLELHLAAFQDLLDVRPQLARLRIDDRELFLDAERKDVVFRDHLTRSAKTLNAQVMARPNAMTAAFASNVTSAHPGRAG